MENPKWESKHVLGALDVRGILALAGVAGPFVLILADLAAAFSEPGYDFVRDSISSLALTPNGMDSNDRFSRYWLASRDLRSRTFSQYSWKARLWA